MNDNPNKIAVYPGSFDPVTFGHLNMIGRASKLFDKLIVAIGINITKKYLFSLDERLAFMREATAGFGNVEVSSYSGLLVDFCKTAGAGIIVRGLRSAADFDNETMLALANRSLDPNIDTIFLNADPQRAFVSSSTVREIAAFGKDVDAYVPARVADAFRALYGKGSTRADG